MSSSNKPLLIGVAISSFIVLSIILAVAGYYYKTFIYDKETTPTKAPAPVPTPTQPIATTTTLPTTTTNTTPTTTPVDPIIAPPPPPNIPNIEKTISGVDGPNPIELCANGITYGTMKYGVWDTPGLATRYELYRLNPGTKQIRATRDGDPLTGVPGINDVYPDVGKRYEITYKCSDTLLTTPNSSIKETIPQTTTATATNVPATTTTATPTTTTTTNVVPPEGNFITNRGSGKCLNVHYGKRANGTELNFHDCNLNQEDKRFVYENNKIRLGNSNYCVDVAAGNGNINAPVQLWECLGNNNNQKFTYENGSFRWWGADGNQTADRYLYNLDGKLVTKPWLKDNLHPSYAPFQRFEK